MQAQALQEQAVLRERRETERAREECSLLKQRLEAHQLVEDKLKDQVNPSFSFSINHMYVPEGSYVGLKSYYDSDIKRETFFLLSAIITPPNILNILDLAFPPWRFLTGKGLALLIDHSLWDIRRFSVPLHISLSSFQASQF